MPNFKDLNSLKKYIQTQVASTLQDDVAKDASDKMKKNYNDEVYSYAYDPEYRDRRMSLTDDENIKKEMVSDTAISISNIARPDKSVFGSSVDGKEGLLGQWIEDGSIPNVFNDRTDYPWTAPRPVIQHTKEEIEGSSSHTVAMRKGLKKRGINVK